MVMVMANILFFILIQVSGEHHDHLHRLIGTRAMDGMNQSKVLYFESLPDKTLDIELAMQNLEFMEQSIKSFEKNVPKLASLISPEDMNLIGDEVNEMKFVTTQLREKIEALRLELKTDTPSQRRVNELARDLYWLFKELLNAHKNAEKKLGIEPPPEPPR